MTQIIIKNATQLIEYQILNFLKYSNKKNG
jgi:hypothetical protein